MEYLNAWLNSLMSDPLMLAAPIFLALSAVFWLLYLCSGNPHETHPLLRRSEGFKHAALVLLVPALVLMLLAALTEMLL